MTNTPRRIEYIHTREELVAQWQELCLENGYMETALHELRLTDPLSPNFEHDLTELEELKEQLKIKLGQFCVNADQYYQLIGEIVTKNNIS